MEPLTSLSDRAAIRLLWSQLKKNRKPLEVTWLLPMIATVSLLILWFY